jgi:hypothetical protein
VSIRSGGDDSSCDSAQTHKLQTTRIIIIDRMTMAETSEETAMAMANCNESQTNSCSSFESSRSVRPLTEESVRAFLVDLYDQFNALAGQQGLTRANWESFYEKKHGEDFVQIRASGNPIDSHGLARLFASGGDVLFLKAQVLVSVDSVILLGNGKVAVVTYTADQSFSYRGVHNEDRVVYSSTIEAINGVPKLVHEHRSSGICIPKETRWGSAANDQSALSSRSNSIDVPCVPYSNMSSSGMPITKEMMSRFSNHSASSPIMDPSKRSVSRDLPIAPYSNVPEEMTRSTSHSASSPIMDPSKRSISRDLPIAPYSKVPEEMTRSSSHSGSSPIMDPLKRSISRD